MRQPAVASTAASDKVNGHDLSGGTPRPYWAAAMGTSFTFWDAVEC